MLRLFPSNYTSRIIFFFLLHLCWNSCKIEAETPHFNPWFGIPFHLSENIIQLPFSCSHISSPFRHRWSNGMAAVVEMWGESGNNDNYIHIHSCLSSIRLYTRWIHAKQYKYQKGCRGMEMGWSGMGWAEPEARTHTNRFWLRLRLTYRRGRHQHKYSMPHA